MKPLVSILIPAHNADRWITETIESALGQTWPRKEIIVVDDGSTDETLAISKRYRSAIISVVSQEKQGAAAARNKAFSLSQGDYIQWLDADDVLAIDKVSKQMEVLSHSGDIRTLVSGAWGTFFYQTSKAKFEPSPLWCDLSPVEWFIRKWKYNAHMQTATWLINRELTQNAGPWDSRLGSNDDGEYLCRVIKQCHLIRFVPEAKVFYRVTGLSRLSYVGQSESKAEARLLGIKLQIQHVLSLEDSERTRSACVEKLRTWLSSIWESEGLTAQTREIAKSIGRELPKPKLGWKYAWMEKICGARKTRKWRLVYNKAKSTAAVCWHALLFRLQRRAGH